MTPRTAFSAAASLALALAAGCMPSSKPPVAAAVPEGATPSSTALPLTVPINAIMVSLVDFSADGVWRPAVQETPLSDRQWLLAEQDATNLLASASLITMRGTGVNDEAWILEPDWRRWAIDMQSTAGQALSAVEAKDQARLKLVGDHLVEICQSCHRKYKPGLPSMGITRFPVYPKRDGTLTPP